MDFWITIEDEWLSEEYHTTPKHNSQNQHFLKIFFELDLREKMFIKKITLLIFQGM